MRLFLHEYFQLLQQYLQFVVPIFSPSTIAAANSNGNPLVHNTNVSAIAALEDCTNIVTKVPTKTKIITEKDSLISKWLNEVVKASLIKGWYRCFQCL